MDLRQKAASNFIWRFLERFGAQGVGFIVSLVLSRRLGPDIYGLVATVTVFTSIVSIFVTCGLNDALIQKKNADDLDFSTVFYFNIVMCVGLYALMYLAAPLIARVYEQPELVAPLRGLSLILILGGIKNVQVAYVSRNMLFKRFFFATLAGTLTAAVVGIWMAVKGYGVWALIVQNLVNTTIDTVILWLTVRWRPKRMFSFERLKGLFSYAWKLLVSSLVDTVYNKLAQIIIGLRYTDADLAYYNKGDTIPSLLVTNINESTNNILLPIMSSEQDNISQVRSMTRRAIQLSSFVIMPMMAGLAGVALPFVRLVLADDWLPCVPYLQIFSFIFAFYCVHTANLNAIKALGRSDLFLKLEIIKKVIGLLTLLVTFRIGVEAIALGQVFTCITSQIINAWPNRKLLGYSYKEQLKDMLPHLLLSLFMGAAVLGVQLLNLPDLITLLIQIPLGVGIYLLGAKVCKMETLDFALGILKGFLKRRKTAA